MDKKQWDELSQVEQDKLAAKFGVSRSGENNSIVTEEALANIPEPKLEPKQDEPKKKTRKAVAKKTVKLGKRGRAVSKRK